MEPTRLSSARESMLATFVCATTTFAFDLGVSVARDWRPPWDYAVACGIFAWVSALIVGGILGWATRRAEIALATWVAFNAWLGTMLFLPPDAMVAFALALVTWGALRLLPQARRSAATSGLATGTAISIVAVILPRLFTVLGMQRPVGLSYHLVLVLAFGVILGAHSLYVRARARIRWLPSEALPSALVLLVLIAIIPLAMTGVAAQESVVLSGRSRPRPASPDGAPPPIIVLVLDTVRADRLSLYGYQRDTTPRLKDFLETHERAVLFPLALSPASWTLPAHASLFTGELPSSHGVNSGRMLDIRHTRYPTDELIAETTLAELMKGAGYQTAAITANASISYFRGMERGFDQFVIPRSPGSLSFVGEKLRARIAPWAFAHQIEPYPPARAISANILRFLDRCAANPCFLVGNYMEAHSPYSAEPPYRGSFTIDGKGWGAGQSDRYDEEILSLDAAVADLLLELEERGVLDNAWVVITADHGEGFGEHGESGHGLTVYNEEVHIPLLVHPPRGERLAASPDAVSLIDVTTTLSLLAGSKPLGAGRDLRNTAAESTVQIELYGGVRQDIENKKPARAVVLGQTKLVESGSSQELYFLDQDPGERFDRSAEAPEAFARLLHLLPPLTPPQESEGSSRELDLEEIERLRALGYIE